MRIFFFLPLLFFNSIHVRSKYCHNRSGSRGDLIVDSTTKQNSLVKNISFTNIGPKVMSGRVVALAVNPENPAEFYVAYASGGVWHTTTNGINFEPISENAPTSTLGTGHALAREHLGRDWRKQRLAVILRRDWDDKDHRHGASWQHAGLSDSHHIGKILIDPKDPNHVIVGVTGHLYSPNSQRGIYETTDGGKQWTQRLFINEETGIIDMAHAPNDFNIQYAAAWEKDRKSLGF